MTDKPSSHKSSQAQVSSVRLSGLSGQAGSAACPISTELCYQAAPQAAHTLQKGLLHCEPACSVSVCVSPHACRESQSVHRREVILHIRAWLSRRRPLRVLQLHRVLHATIPAVLSAVSI